MNIARKYKTIGFSVPPMIATRIEEVVKERQFTRSELFREMFRVWEKKEREERDSDEQILKLFAEVKEEKEKKPISKEEMLEGLKEVSRALRKRARERGLIVTEEGEIREKRV
jgi:Arc/MetJ-type ribon-helix-helix transcriptional regulator